MAVALEHQQGVACAERGTGALDRGCVSFLRRKTTLQRVHATTPFSRLARLLSQGTTSILRAFCRRAGDRPGHRRAAVSGNRQRDGGGRPSESLPF